MSRRRRGQPFNLLGCMVVAALAAVLTTLLGLLAR